MFDFLSSLATNTALGLKANTSDVTTSLATKVDKVTGKELSTNDYTTAEKNKLTDIIHLVIHSYSPSIDG